MRLEACYHFACIANGPTISAQNLAIDPTAVGTCEERNHRSDVGGLTQPLQRCDILQVLRHLNVMSLVQLCRNLVEPGLVSGHQNHGMAVPSNSRESSKPILVDAPVISALSGQCLCPNVH